jgi:CSLREA domain-containing protein
MGALQTAAEPQAPSGRTIAVTTTADEYNTVPNATCSLREAIRTANDDANFGGCTRVFVIAGMTINIPGNTYTLTRDGIDEDLNSTGDLDIRASMVLDGAGGAGDVVIKGKAGYSGRIIQVHSGSVVLRDMTLRDGNLSNGRAGAGLRTEPDTTTTLNNVVVGSNTADGNAGGILNRGTMTLNGSAVTNNIAVNPTQGGGGLFNDDNATLTLNDSRVLNNTAEGEVAGGGLYNDVGATLVLDNTTVDGNKVEAAPSLTIVLSRAYGGGIFSDGVLNIVQSTISNNSTSAELPFAGGIYAGAGGTIIDRTLITGNAAQCLFGGGGNIAFGGGIHQSAGQLGITNSIISNNPARSTSLSAFSGGGGGLFVSLSLTATVINSTISGNSATMQGEGADGFGGGFFVRAGGSLIVVNSTISGNNADADGGGVFLQNGDASLYSTTVKGNTSNADGTGGGTGGGIAMLDVLGSVVTMRNSVLAGNLENNIGDHDDCDGGFISAGNNLVQNTSGCSISGGNGSDILNQPAKLGAFASNGGPAVGATTSPIIAGMGTHKPANDSPLLDHGASEGCKDDNGDLLASDQRGEPRIADGPDPNATATCDIGAVEVQEFDRIFKDGFD